MKKGLIKTFAGVAALSSLFAVNVHALGVDEGNNSDSTNVVVGEVDTPVYTVGIRWGEFSYHWAYNSETGSYEWKDSKVERCGQALPRELGSATGIGSIDYVSYSEEEYNEQVAAGNVFSDSTCSTVVDDISYNELGDENNAVYSIKSDDSYQGLAIYDSSTLGQVVPSIEWNPTDDYDWTTGEFEYSTIEMTCELVTDEVYSGGDALYSDTSCSVYVSDAQQNYQPNTFYKQVFVNETHIFAGGELPDSARVWMGAVFDEDDKYSESSAYDVNFNLGVDEGKTVKTPKVGDTIGTITVSFRAK